MCYKKQKPDTTSLDIFFFPQRIDLVDGSRRQPNRAAKYLFLLANTIHEQFFFPLIV
jgi:hypothetical protein